MCTAMVKHGCDYIAAFNFDVDPNVWKYGIHKTEICFFIEIDVGSTRYKIHGVNSSGQYSVLPYMNGTVETKLHRGAQYQRIDLLDGKWLSAQLPYETLLSILQTKRLIDVPGCSMHALFSDKDGHIVLAEPNAGYRLYDEQCAVVSNFPLINQPEDLSNPFYGVDRFRIAEEKLRASGDDFSVSDAFSVLESVKQEGMWGTRVSFVYSGSENAVYYCTDGDFNTIQCHRFPR